MSATSRRVHLCIDKMSLKRLLSSLFCPFFLVFFWPIVISLRKEWHLHWDSNRQSGKICLGLSRNIRTGYFENFELDIFRSLKYGITTTKSSILYYLFASMQKTDIIIKREFWRPEVVPWKCVATVVEEVPSLHLNALIMYVYTVTDDKLIIEHISPL